MRWMTNHTSDGKSLSEGSKNAFIAALENQSGKPDVSTVFFR